MPPAEMGLDGLLVYERGAEKESSQEVWSRLVRQVLCGYESVFQ